MSSTTFIKDFKFTRDFRQILWKETIWYNLLRSFAAGCILGLLSLIFSPSETNSSISLAPLLWPFCYLFFFLPVGILFSILKNLPFVGLLAGFFSIIAVAIGDPLVFLIHKFAPKAVPVESPSFFSFYLIFWLLDPKESEI